MQVSRRKFLEGAAALAVTGCTTAPAVSGFTAPGEMRAVLLHLGWNMWCDWIPPDMDPAAVAAASGSRPGRTVVPDAKLRSNDALLAKACDHAAAKGLNAIVLDLGEGLVYPSHPELAIEGSWSPEKLQRELRRLNALGLEVIPKLNFSTTHNGWLKHYRRMLSTPAYYRVCEDVIADVAEIFGRPRFLHIGFDEETATHQDNSGRCLLINVRKGEFWWHDFLHIVRTVEKNGMRAWAWSDYGWHHPDYYARCPKSVLQSNWYYDESCYGFEIAEKPDNLRLKGFYDLQKAGFEQVPCGTNWAGFTRRQLKIGGEDVIGRLVRMCRRDITSRRLGFLMAPWASCDTPEHFNFNIRGIDLFADALRA